MEIGIASSKKPVQKIQWMTKTWYGLPVKIVVSSDNFHKIAVPGLSIPHPGLVNFITRQGFPLKFRLALIARHELGHLQTLPIPLLHLVILLWPRRGRPAGHGLLRWLVAILTHQAVWELAAESYTLVTERQMEKPPRGRSFRFLYASFWAAMLGLMIAGTRYLLQREEIS